MIAKVRRWVEPFRGLIAKEENCIMPNPRRNSATKARKKPVRAPKRLPATPEGLSVREKLLYMKIPLTASMLAELLGVSAESVIQSSPCSPPAIAPTSWWAPLRRRRDRTAPVRSHYPEICAVKPISTLENRREKVDNQGAVRVILLILLLKEIQTPAYKRARGGKARNRCTPL